MFTTMMADAAAGMMGNAVIGNHAAGTSIVVKPGQATMAHQAITGLRRIPVVIATITIKA